MSDLTTIARNIELDADSAMRGNQEALGKLRAELHLLHTNQLDALAPILEKDLGKTFNSVMAGVQIDRNSQGDVSSITFVPQIQDRSITGQGSHSVSTDLSMNNFVDDVTKLFPKLDTNKDGTIGLTELGDATVNKKLTPHEASLLSVLAGVEQDCPQFAKGITQGDLSFLRGDWKHYPRLAKELKAAEANVTGNHSLFGPNGVSPDAVSQGMLGDCVFESALISIATQSPNKIKNMIKENQNGTYTATFSPGFTTTVSAPTAGELAVGNRNGANGIWPIILEKAAIQVEQEKFPDEHLNHLLSLDGLNPGLTLTLLTNRTTDDMNNLKMSGEKVAAFLEKHLSQHDPVIAGALGLLSDGLTADGYPGGHAYAVVGFDPNGPNGGTVTVRNPWNVKDGPYDGKFQMSLWAFRANFTTLSAANMGEPPLLTS